MLEAKLVVRGKQKSCQHHISCINGPQQLPMHALTWYRLLDMGKNHREAPLHPHLKVFFTDMGVSLSSDPPNEMQRHMRRKKVGTSEPSGSGLNKIHFVSSHDKASQTLSRICH